MAIAPSKRELDSDSKQAFILKKSQELFREYGYKKTTINDICTACNMNVGTVYHFFGSKGGILQAICAEMSHSGVLSENISARAHDPYKAFMEFHLDYAERWQKMGVDLTKHFYNQFQRLYFHPTTATYQPSETVEEIALFIQAAQEAGTFDPRVDAMDTAYMFILIGRGVIYDWCLHEGSYDLVEKSEQVMGRVTKLLIAGIPVSTENPSAKHTKNTPAKQPEAP